MHFITCISCSKLPLRGSLEKNKLLNDHTEKKSVPSTFCVQCKQLEIFVVDASDVEAF